MLRCWRLEAAEFKFEFLDQLQIHVHEADGHEPVEAAREAVVLVLHKRVRPRGDEPERRGVVRVAVVKKCMGTRMRGREKSGSERKKGSARSIIHLVRPRKHQVHLRPPRRVASIRDTNHARDGILRLALEDNIKSMVDSSNDVRCGR